MCNLFILYAIKSSIIGQIVSLIHVMTNFSFSLQLPERHFIGLSKNLNFILISGIICQERALHGYISVKCKISKGPFSLNKTN